MYHQIVWVLKSVVEISVARRKSDLVVSIVQNNNNKAVLISDANDALLALLSYSRTELRGRHLFDILDETNKSKILEHLEYEDYGIDIENILTRTKQLNLKTKHGVTVPLKIKIFPSNSSSSKEHRYEILAREYSCIDHLADFRRAQRHFEYSMDNMLRVLDSQATGDELILLSQFCQHYRESCIVGFLQLSDTSKTMMLRAIESIKKSIRHTDQIGIFGTTLVIFIIGCDAKVADRPMLRIIEKARVLDKEATLKYFSLLEHPVLDLKTDLPQKHKIFLKTG